jgi:DNA modification methylase
LAPSCQIITGDCLTSLATLPDGVAQTCVTSPPYWGLRDYGVEGQLGLEPTPDEYVARMVEVFRAVRRTLADDGTLWLNLGDSYAATTKGSGGPSAKQDSNAGSRYAPKRLDLKTSGIKPKDLVGIPWRVAFALQADGWYLRSDIIWHKPNPMPESVTDRPTKAHEYLFLLAKSERYYYDADAVREPHAHPELARKKVANPNAGRQGDYQKESGRNDGGPHVSGVGFRSDPDKGRNRRTVWTVTPKPYRGAHFATYPPDLIEPCILAGSRPGDLVLDPFNGAGTTGLVALRHGRHYIGCELNPEYVELTQQRLAKHGA